MLDQTRSNEAHGTRAIGAAARVDALRNQAGVYRLLGRCLEQEVDGELLGLLRNDLRGALAEAGVVLDEAFVQTSEARLLETLAEEYTGLFVAPGAVSPYLSVFETGCLFREPCDRVMAAYREAGWDYQRQYSGEFPDHLGTMLGFVGMLFDVQAEAVENGDMALAGVSAERRERFVVDLLGPWAPGLCRRAAEASLHAFYGQILELTEQVLWSELSTLTDRRTLRQLVESNRRAPAKLDYDADFRKASGI